MPIAFYPQRYLDIKASKPHPQGTTYRVSVGWENWGDDEMKRVLKVQMVYDGRVTGRKVPSYPEASNDFEEVMKAVQRVKKGEGLSGRWKIFPAGGEVVEPENE